MGKKEQEYPTCLPKSVVGSVRFLLESPMLNSEPLKEPYKSQRAQEVEFIEKLISDERMYAVWNSLKNHPRADRFFWAAYHANKDFKQLSNERAAAKDNAKKIVKKASEIRCLLERQHSYIFDSEGFERCKTRVNDVDTGASMECVIGYSQVLLALENYAKNYVPITDDITDDVLSKRKRSRNDHVRFLAGYMLCNGLDTDSRDALEFIAGVTDVLNSSSADSPISVDDIRKALAENLGEDSP